MTLATFVLSQENRDQHSLVRSLIKSCSVSEQFCLLSQKYSAYHEPRYVLRSAGWGYYGATARHFLTSEHLKIKSIYLHYSEPLYLFCPRDMIRHKKKEECRIGSPVFRFERIFTRFPTMTWKLALGLSLSTSYHTSPPDTRPGHYLSKHQLFPLRENLLRCHR